MLQKTLLFGVIAGLIAGGPLFTLTVLHGGLTPSISGMVIGYTSMLLALSMVFMAVKRHRDRVLGGVIGFWPALGLGLAISAVASLVYALVWEAAQGIAGLDFGATYAKSVIEAKQAAGASAEELAETVAAMEDFQRQYAQLIYRLPMTFSEMFPVGLLVSLFCAGVLRNPSVLPLRRD
jgi:hypothetical protein